MGSTREKALVGLFVIVAGVLLFAAAMVLTGGRCCITAVVRLSADALPFSPY